MGFHFLRFVLLMPKDMPEAAVDEQPGYKSLIRQYIAWASPLPGLFSCSGNPIKTETNFQNGRGACQQAIYIFSENFVNSCK
jgi:hypothetical protein